MLGGVYFGSFYEFSIEFFASFVLIRFFYVFMLNNLLVYVPVTVLWQS